MNTYTRLSGEVLALDRLQGDQRAYIDAAYRAMRDQVTWAEMLALVYAKNPFLDRGFVTREIYGTTFFQVLQDLLDRVGVQSGQLAPVPGDESDRDPFDDHMITVSNAAHEASVTLQTIYLALDRGDLVGSREVRPALVSRNSLRHWSPQPHRQRAGRQSRQRASA